MRRLAPALGLVVAMASCDRDARTTDMPREIGSAAIASDATVTAPVLIDAAADVRDAAVVDAVEVSGSSAAAGSGAGSASATKKKVKVARPIGREGSICGCSAERPQSACRAVTCPTDLVCAYPCGVQGCNSVCMTPQEAEDSKFLP